MVSTGDSHTHTWSFSQVLLWKNSRSSNSTHSFLIQTGHQRSAGQRSAFKQVSCPSITRPSEERLYT